MKILNNRRLLISALIPVLVLNSFNSYADRDPNKVIDYTGSAESLGSWSFESADSFASNDSMGSQNSLDNWNSFSFNRKTFDVKCVNSLGKYDKYLNRYKRTDIDNLVNPNLPVGSSILARDTFMPYWNKLGTGTYDANEDKVTFVRPGLKAIACNAATRPQFYYWFDGYLNGINRLDKITPKILEFKLLLKPFERIAETSNGGIAITWNKYSTDGSYYYVNDYWMPPKVRDAQGHEVIARFEILSRTRVRLHVLTRERIQYPIVMSTGFTHLASYNFPPFAQRLKSETIKLWKYQAWKKHIEALKHKKKHSKAKTV